VQSTTPLPPDFKPPFTTPYPAAGKAEAYTKQVITFPTFYAGLGATPNTNHGREIVEALKLQATLSNPKLALTVFMPEDQVTWGWGGVGVVFDNVWMFVCAAVKIKGDCTRPDAVLRALRRRSKWSEGLCRARILKATP
jgi:hypothetical protein